jgi:thiamine pyrophosphokinase
MTTVAANTETVIVLLGGEPINAQAIGDLPTGCIVIAADSGVQLAPVLGLNISVVIGDMDSIDATALEALKALGTIVVQHAADKNESDAELALVYAASLGATRLIVISGGGGRLDHQLALFAVMFLDSLQGTRLEVRLGYSRAHPVRAGETVTISCATGDVIGLIPFGGDAHGVTTSNLHWPLRDESLIAASRGISNRAMSDEFSVTVTTGRLIVTVDAPA